jgi:hypothetical protein
MFIDCKLVLKSYVPEKLEKGMWFVRVKTEVIYGDKQEYLSVHELALVPRDMDTYLTYNGYPVKPYLVYPMINPDDTEVIAATPDQIGWWDEGEHVDELRDITVKDINNILEWDNSMVQIEILDDEEDEEDGTPIPLLYDNKVTLRDVHTIDSDDWIDNYDDEDHLDDGDDDVWDAEDHNTE